MGAAVALKGKYPLFVSLQTNFDKIIGHGILRSQLFICLTYIRNEKIAFPEYSRFFLLALLCCLYFE